MPPRRSRATSSRGRPAPAHDAPRLAREEEPMSFSGSALRRGAVPLIAAAFALLRGADARAQSVHLVWPEIGAGPAGFVFNGAGGGAWQIDASIGIEREGEPL